MKENNYMSKEYTNCLRGIFAILVVFHHLHQYTELLSGEYIGTILQTLGFLCVAMFFFFSGYGLMFSSDKENYINSFLKKRFVPLYLFYVILIILYGLWTLLLEKQLSFQRVVRSFLFGGTIVTNGWYMQATFIAYLLFYFCFKIFKKKQIKIASFGIAIIVYSVFCILFNLNIFWYQTIPCMLLGMVFCYKKNTIDVLLKRHSWLILILNAILFSGCFLLSILSNIDVIFNVLYTLFFVCFAITLSYILYNTPIIKNKFFELCGRYSLEIYVSHGFFLRLIKLKYIENKFLYIAVVIVGTVLVSIVMKIIYKQTTLVCQKINKTC